jgi:aminopeptidase N
VRCMSRFAFAFLLMASTLGSSACSGADDPVSDDDLRALTFHGVKVLSADKNLPDVDVTSYDFDLDATGSAGEPSVLSIAGSVEISFVAMHALDRVTFDYTGQGAVTSVTQGATPLRYEKKENTLAVSLAKPIAAGKAIAVRIAFSAVPERENGGGARTRGLTFDAGRELFTANWPNRARQWFPCIDNPRDAAMFAVKLRTPSTSDVALSNGKRTEKTLPDGRSETVHEMLHPIPTYAFFLGVSKNWTRETSPVPGRGDLETYLEGTNASARAAKRKAVFDDTDDAFAYFSATFAPFAWETLRFVEVPTTWGGGGMEHVSAISIDPADFADPKNARLTMIHELAHQWSGDLVRIASWNDFWLSEGFTEYLTRRFVEEHDGAAAANELWTRSIDGGKRAAHALRPNGDLETGATPSKIMSAIFDNVAYDKGAWVMRVLEQKVGRAKFTSFLASWFKNHKHQAVTTETFKSDLEAFTGKDFSAFFQSAVYGTAKPE